MCIRDSSTPYRNQIDDSNPADPQENTGAKLKGVIPDREYVKEFLNCEYMIGPVSYTHLRAHETGRNLVCRLLP